MKSNVKKLELNDSNIVQRPWGFYKVISSSFGYLVKEIHVVPGKKISLQKHKYRAEHWVVVSGKAKITRNEEVIFLEKNQSTYIPQGVIHRLENTEKTPLIIIEVQSGNYIGEDDITRLEDEYGRINKKIN